MRRPMFGIHVLDCVRFKPLEDKGRTLVVGKLPETGRSSCSVAHAGRTQAAR